MKPLTAREVRRRTGGDGRRRCARCGSTARQCAERAPAERNINHPEYRYSWSFQTDIRGRSTCAACAQEEALEACFAAMDAREKRDKEAVKA